MKIKSAIGRSADKAYRHLLVIGASVDQQVLDVGQPNFDGVGSFEKLGELRKGSTRC
jgi:hypothetical protein